MYRSKLKQIIDCEDWVAGVELVQCALRHKGHEAVLEHIQTVYNYALAECDHDEIHTECRGPSRWEALCLRCGAKAIAATRFGACDALEESGPIIADKPGALVYVLHVASLGSASPGAVKPKQWASAYKWALDAHFGAGWYRDAGEAWSAWDAGPGRSWRTVVHDGTPVPALVGEDGRIVAILTPQGVVEHGAEAYPLPPPRPR